VFIRLRPGERVTETFLFHRVPAHAPDAFTLARRENRQALDALLGGPPIRDAAPAGRLCIRPLPSPAAETATDWHGGTLAEALERLVDLTGVAIGSRDGCVDVSGPVWTALLRGGAQGAVWAVDTLRQWRRAKRSLAALTAQWRREAA
jgi:hypothetical protein